MDIYTPLKQLTADLNAAGVRATMDAQDLNPPAVYVTPGRIDDFTFCGGEMEAVLYLVVGDTVESRALANLNDELAKFMDLLNTTVQYAWTGTPGASMSTKMIDGIVVATNSSPNPSFETSATDTSTAQAAVLGSRSSDFARQGSFSWKAVVQSGATPSYMNLISQAVGPYETGEEVRFRFYIHLPNPSTFKDWRLTLAESGATYESTPYTLFAATPIADDWYECDTVHTVPPGVSLSTYYVQTRPTASRFAAGDTGYVDTVLVAPASVDSYFDGDTPDIPAPNLPIVPPITPETVLPASGGSPLPALRITTTLTV